MPINGLYKYFRDTVLPNEKPTDKESYSRWIKDFKCFHDRLKGNLGKRELNETFLEELWYKRKNKFASVGQGGLSEKEFHDNLGEYRSQTLEICEQPIRSTYDKIIRWNEWAVAAHKLRCRHFVVTQRMFQGSAPDRYLPLNERQLVELAESLQRQQVIPWGTLPDHWFDKQNFLRSEITKHGVDFSQAATDYTANAFAWYLYCLTVTDRHDIRLVRNA